MKKCSFNGCQKAAFSKGLCGAHYQQHRLGKELKPLQVQHHGLSEEERFRKWYQVAPNGCWMWIGSVILGGKRSSSFAYGQWRNGKGEHELAHRAAYRMFVGPIPVGLGVLHRCDIPRCVNPAHLFVGTHRDNMADMWSKGRATPGVSRGESHGMSKLTEEVIREIRSSKENGPEIAKRLGISTTNVYDIRNRRLWKHIA